MLDSDEDGMTSPAAVTEDDPIAALVRRSMFWRPQYLAASAWLEHIPFAFWIVDVLRPRVLVELGTHLGPSYFALCQAVQQLGLRTACYAVDTWRGDEHAGFYGEEVFNAVNAENEARYSGFSRLVRSTFDEALGYFADGSVDLLHIDGLHSYDAVRHDFETWLPRLSDRAVVLFHDTNVRERGFGVHRFIEELSRARPTFEFLHGHGLAVVAVGSGHPAPLRRLLAASGEPETCKAVREVFGRLGQACSDGYALRGRHRVGAASGHVSLAAAEVTAQAGGVSWTGDIAGARWSTRLGGYALSFMNDLDGDDGAADGSGEAWGEAREIGGVTYRDRMRLHRDGRVESAGGFAVAGHEIADGGGHLRLRVHALDALPPAGAAGGMIAVSGDPAGRPLLVSDGTCWRWPDGAPAS